MLLAEYQRAEFLLDAIKRAYAAMPVTATPEEFIAGGGNWGLTESEYCVALILADALTSPRSKS